MGWLSMTSLDGHKGPKQYLDNQLTFERPSGVTSKVLKSALVKFRTYYAAVEYVSPEGGREVIGCVCLVQYNPRAKDGYIFGYKDMDESCGPHQTECPESILDLLTPTESEYARQWRENCRANIAKSRLPKPKSGDKIVFAHEIIFHGGTLKLTEFTIHSRPGKRGVLFYNEGGLYRIRNWKDISHSVTPAVTNKVIAR